MRRAGNLWPEIVSFPNLLTAARRASLGKRNSAAVARFLERAEPEVLRIRRELMAGEWRPTRGSRFEIRDPKPRTITVVPFRDQVVHHGLLAPLEPVFERRMIDDSYACRKGKGTHAALRRARHFLRRRSWFLKLDVRSFFASVRSEVVMETMTRIVKDARVLDLCRRILEGPPGLHGEPCGLPLGSLTSQWFANLVLDRLDHHVKETLRIPGYVRYMDDLALFADSAEVLRAAHVEVERYLAAPLALALKERATLLARAEHGLPFLGWHLFRGTARVRPENLRRYFWRIRFRRWQYETGRRTEASFRQGVASVFELLRQGDTHRLRRSWCERHRLEL